LFVYQTDARETLKNLWRHILRAAVSEQMDYVLKTKGKERKNQSKKKTNCKKT
jgi:hypothetical protein